MSRKHNSPAQIVRAVSSAFQNECGDSDEYDELKTVSLSPESETKAVTDTIYPKHFYANVCGWEDRPVIVGQRGNM